MALADSHQNYGWKCSGVSARPTAEPSSSTFRRTDSRGPGFDFRSRHRIRRRGLTRGSA